MKIKILLICIVSLFCLQARPNSGSTESQCDGKEGDVATISGLLTRKVVWGPPNFGDSPKTDQKISIWVVRLNKNYGLQLANGLPTACLVFDKAQVNWRKILVESHSKSEIVEGKRVNLSGRFWHATSAGDYFSVIIDVTAVKIIN